MYCLYESINKHNAVVTFLLHALAMFWDQNQKNRSKIDDVIILQNLDSKRKKMSITSKIPEISKIPYKQKCLRIRYYTQYWNFRSIEWLVNMSTHEVHAPLKSFVIKHLKLRLLLRVTRAHSSCVRSKTYSKRDFFIKQRKFNWYKTIIVSIKNS